MWKCGLNPKTTKSDNLSKAYFNLRVSFCEEMPIINNNTFIKHVCKSDSYIHLN